MTRLPRPRWFDQTRSFLRAPYTFIGTTCARLGGDSFETRLFLRPTVCLRGEALAALFYDSDLFERRGASPGWLPSCPFGRADTRLLDDLAQRQRQDLLRSIVRSHHVARARRLFKEEWTSSVMRWKASDRVVLYDELHPLLTRVACTWAGIPLPEVDVATRTKDLVALFDTAGGLGVPRIEARLAQRRVDTWLEHLVRDVRGGGSVEPSSVLARLAHTRLEQTAAAVELRSLLRSMVALSAYIVSLALALHRHPHTAPTSGDERTAFIQEVRRYYPFFPVAVGRVRQDFEWEGMVFRAGTMAFLDLFGTNRDPKTWTTPDAFSPTRFADSPPRPGEELSLAILDEALIQLTEHMRYRVPAQNLGIDMGRLPALPQSRLVLEGVRAAPRPDRVPDSYTQRLGDPNGVARVPGRKLA